MSVVGGGGGSTTVGDGRAAATRYVVLPNGLRVLVREMRLAPAVALNLWVASGSVDDADELGGISHFIEHMLFKAGGETVDLAREVQEAGGHLNAQTGLDHTMYHQVVPSRGWETVLAAQASALLDADFAPEDVETERAVIIEEARGAEEMPETFVWRRLMETIFLRHPCRRPVVGTEESLRRITPADLRSHYAAHYGARNLIQVIVGDVDAEHAVDVARSTLSALPDVAPPPRRSPPEAPQEGLRAAASRGDIAQPYLAAGFRIPPVLHDDLPALDMACGLLGLGRSSRLRKTLQVGGGLVSDLSAGIAGFRDHGVLVVRATLTEGDVDRVVKAVFGAIRELAARPPGEDEMRRAVRRLEAAYVLEHEVPEAVAQTLGFFEVLGDYRRGDAYLDRLASVTPADVARVTDAHLVARNATVVTHVPGSLWRGEENTRERMERAAAAASEQAVVRESARAYAAEPFRRPLIIGERIDYDVRSEEFSAGGRLIIFSSPALPIVSIAVGFRGGFVGEPEGHAGITYLSERVATRGAGGRSAPELADEMEGYGSAVATVVDRDGFGHGAAALSRHFAEIVGLLGDVIERPSFEADQVEAARAEVAAEIGSVMDHPLRRATTRLLPLIFGDHPYGRALRGTRESVAAVSREEIARWHRSIAGSDRLVVAVVGDVRVGAAAEAIAEAFGDLESSTADQAVRAAPRPRLELSEFESGAAGRSTIALAYPLAPAADPDSLVARFVSRSISMMGGRLWVALRERGPNAYFAGSSCVSLAESGAFLVHAMVPGGAEEEAIGAARGVLAGVAREGFGAGELARAKRHFAGTHELSMQRSSTRAATYVMAELLGLGFERVDETPGLVESITNDDIVRTARKYLGGDCGFAAVVDRGGRGS